MDGPLPHKDDGYTVWEGPAGCQGDSEEGLTLAELGTKPDFLEEVKDSGALLEDNPGIRHPIENVPRESERTH